MSGMIKINGNSNKANNIPIIKNLRTDDIIKPTEFTIKYIAEDFENTILRHYIYINGEKKEITKDVGYEKPNNEFIYCLSNLINNTLYSIQIELSDGINIVQSSILNIKTPEAKILGISVDEKNSSPEQSVSYIENSIGKTPANKNSLGEWIEEFPYNKIRIVGFKNGKVTKEVDVFNKSKYKDGSSVPSDVDVMVEIPKVYWKFTNTINGYELRIANVKVDDSYDCYAHKINGIEKDNIYIGAYLGSIQNGKLRSVSNVMPTHTKNIVDFRISAQANGSGYQQMNWFTLTLIQILYLIAYKNLNSQSAIGMGYTEGSSLTSTGGTLMKGLCYGSIDGRIQMCFLGIEDLWGNIRMWIDGMKISSRGELLVNSKNTNFNDSAEGYENIGKCNISNGRISKTIHTNKGGFFPMEFSGSDTIYYCDNGWLGYDNIGICGGYCTDKKSAGIFYIRATYHNGNAYQDIGSRLCYLG